MFYEDVPRRPWPLLRLILPRPVHSEGDKQSVGSLIRCSYERGYLVKRITRVEPARMLGFEVTEQRLGIERYARASGGSYRLEPAGQSTLVTLTTEYRASLRPRLLWSTFERYLCHRLHDHVLSGMDERLAAERGAERALKSATRDGQGSAPAPGR
jgi:hypothetical protein